MEYGAFSRPETFQEAHFRQSCHLVSVPPLTPRLWQTLSDRSGLGLVHAQSFRKQGTHFRLIVRPISRLAIRNHNFLPLGACFGPWHPHDRTIWDVMTSQIVLS